MQSEEEVVHGLRIAFVHEEDDVLIVAIYGGADPTFGTIRYVFPDDAERATNLKTLARWARRDTPVTLRWCGREVTLCVGAAAAG
jgi:hypothetical protein